MQVAVKQSWRSPPTTRAAAERLLFALRCTLAACISYAIADRLWPQLPLWAPVSALVVSQHQWRQTEKFVSGLPLGTFVGAAIAVLAAMIGHALGMSLLGQVGLAVAVSAALSMNWTSARAALWMSLIGVWLIDRVPGRMVTSAGLMMAEEVVLGSIVGGLIAALFEFAGRSRRSLIDLHGVKRSDFGRACGAFGIRKFVNIKSVHAHALQSSDPPAVE